MKSVRPLGLPPEQQSHESLAQWFESLPACWQESLIDAVADDRLRSILIQYYQEGVELEDLAARFAGETARVRHILRRFHLLAAETVCDYYAQRVFK